MQAYPVSVLRHRDVKASEPTVKVTFVEEDASSADELVSEPETAEIRVFEETVTSSHIEVAKSAEDEITLIDDADDHLPAVLGPWNTKFAAPELIVLALLAYAAYRMPVLCLCWGIVIVLFNGRPGHGSSLGKVHEGIARSVAIWPIMFSIAFGQSIRSEAL